eukprot:2172793-Lingulodinium_polyedra.AAC.1
MHAVVPGMAHEAVPDALVARVLALEGIDRDDLPEEIWEEVCPKADSKEFAALPLVSRVTLFG